MKSLLCSINFFLSLSHYFLIWSISSSQTVHAWLWAGHAFVYVVPPQRILSLLSAYLNSIHAESPGLILRSLYFLSFIIYSTHLVPHQIRPLVTVLDLMLSVKCSWTYVWLWVRDGKDFRYCINAQCLTLAAYRALLRRTQGSLGMMIRVQNRWQMSAVGNCK